MTKKRRILFGMNPPLRADGHLTDAWLLLAIDGELSAADYAVVKEHVRACWTCRARKEYLERRIEEIVEYEQALVAPDMPPSPGGRAIFLARLDQLAAELGRPSLIQGWAIRGWAIRRRARALLSLSSPAVWATLAPLTIALVFYIALPRNRPGISANELLQRATASESRPLSGINQPVIVQKVSIQVHSGKMTDRAMTRTLYRDAVHQREAQRADVSAREEIVVERDFERSSLNWDDPLSPQAYSRWRDGLRDGTDARKDVVTELSGGLLKLDTSASSGPVAEASLTVREDDYHPVAEGLRLRDNTQIEVAELSYEVVGLSTLNPEIFGAPAPVEPLRLPAIAANLPVRAALPDEAQLALSELQVRAALHGIGADLGEQISVQQGANGLVEVDGIAEDEARRRQIADALTGIPFTELRVKTIAQVMAHPRSSASPAIAATFAANPPLLEEQLKERFPDDDQRTEYVNQSLALCQSASARAWALNRLADRYTPQQIALLGPGARQQLQRLLSDHIGALREDIGRLQNQLGQVLSPASNTAAANTTVGVYTKTSSPEIQADGWRDQVHRVHSSVETTNEAVAVLLGGSSEGGDSPDKLQLRLRTTLTQLQAELQLLDQQVHKQL